MKILFAFLLLSVSSAMADTHVLFFVKSTDSPTPKAVSSKVYEVYPDGAARVSVTTYYSQTYRRKYYIIPGHLLTQEVPEFAGFHTKDVVCLKTDVHGGSAGTDVEIQHLYPNGKAEVHFGDFFGQRFSIFRRSEVLDISKLQSCNAK